MIPILKHLWHRVSIPAIWIADKCGADFLVNALLKLHMRVVRWRLRP